MDSRHRHPMKYAIVSPRLVATPLMLWGAALVSGDSDQVTWSRLQIQDLVPKLDSTVVVFFWANYAIFLGTIFITYTLGVVDVMIRQTLNG
jgi:hypothetical protein